MAERTERLRSHDCHDSFFLSRDTTIGDTRPVYIPRDASLTRTNSEEFHLFPPASSPFLPLLSSRLMVISIRLRPNSDSPQLYHFPRDMSRSGRRTTGPLCHEASCGALIGRRHLKGAKSKLAGVKGDIAIFKPIFDTNALLRNGVVKNGERNTQRKILFYRFLLSTHVVLALR